MMFYTGIGSRGTPDDVLRLMEVIAGDLASRGFVLRSGAAQGADSAFERGALSQAHIYVPWRGFSKSPNIRSMTPNVDAYKLASTLHPAWMALSRGAKALHARNCHQVLGDDLKTPSLFVVCWTSDGCESESTRTKSTGGTATAIALASRMGIPVFNLKNAEARVRMTVLIDDLFTL